MNELTVEQKKKLAEILETWDTYHRAIRFINVLGRILKWILGAGSAFAIMWGAWHGGAPK